MRHEYTLVDVFTKTKFGGNQLAVFRDGAKVPESAMQSIAKELNLPETVFAVRHGLADGERIVVEQGYEMGRPSLLYIRIGGTKDAITSVHVGGHAVLAGGGWIDA